MLTFSPSLENKTFRLPYIAQICKVTAVYVIVSEHGIQ